MTVNEVYDIILYACAKNLQQGYVSPADFNLIIKQASKSYATYLLGGFQQYAPGRPIPRVEFGNNATVRQRLSPIIYGYNLTIDSTGFSSYPGDYLQTDSMWSIYGNQRIRYIPQEKLWFVYGDPIDPYQSNPFYMIEDVGFRFLPVQPFSYNQARLSYVRTPPDMIWGYDEDENGIPVYNPAKSTQPVWDDSSILEIIVRALRIIGVSTDIQTVSQYANEIKATGQ